jgi:hypothetical protein
MPDQLFTYFIENPLMIISINSGSWGIMVIRLVIDFGKLVKVALKRSGVEKGSGEEVWELLGFVALVCVLVIFVLLQWKVLVSGNCKGLGLCTVGIVC